RVMPPVGRKRRRQQGDSASRCHESCRENSTSLARRRSIPPHVRAPDEARKFGASHENDGQSLPNLVCVEGTSFGTQILDRPRGRPSPHFSKGWMHRGP